MLAWTEKVCLSSRGPNLNACLVWQTHNFLQAALMPMELKARGEVEYSLNGVEISNPTGRANL